MLDFDHAPEIPPLLGDLDRRRLHADLQRITLELQRFALDLQCALGRAGSGANAPVDLMLGQLERALRCVGELDGALALLAEPECQGC